MQTTNNTLKKLTVEKAKFRADSRSGGRKGGDAGKACAIQKPVANPEQRLVTQAEVTRMIAQAIEARLPKPDQDCRMCQGCGQNKLRSGFAGPEWPKPEAERRCLECRPVAEHFMRSKKDGKVCCFCNMFRKRDTEFSRSQWDNGKKAKCKACVHECKEGEASHLRPCVACGESKVHAAFAKSQRDKSLEEGSKCLECAERDPKASQENFTEARRTRPSSQPVAPSEWSKGDKAEALRWVLEAPPLSLPSICRKSYQATRILRGLADWASRLGSPDESGFSPLQKLDWIKTSHEELSHMGGGDAVCVALEEVGRKWTNMVEDARWVVRRCERCLVNTTRDTAKVLPITCPSLGWQGRSLAPMSKHRLPKDSPSGLCCWQLISARRRSGLGTWIHRKQT